MVGSAKAESLRTDLPLVLRTACEQGPACSPAVLYVENDASFSLLRSALLALTAALPSKEVRPVVQLRLGKPEAPGTPPRVRVGAHVSGRLPAKVIQRIVRGSFGGFRKCYEGGLSRDANLSGKVTVRFVIGRDGRVSRAIAADGTTMPDAEVTECVVSHFRTLQFPAPDGGIVTVVYPIMLAPG